MKTQKFFLIFLLSLAFLHCKNDESQKEPEKIEPWILTFEDNFDGNEFQKPDAFKWEMQNYNRRQNENGPDGWWDDEDVYLSGDGNLVIRVRKIENRNDDNDSHDYSVGMVRSKGIFEQKFGKFEVRCKLPKDPGWWVAFWLYSESVPNEDGSGEDGTEIDIMEGFGWTDQVQHALHYDGYDEAHQSIGKKVNIESLREGYHTYTLEWNEDVYKFFIDGEETWRSNFGGVSKVPAYVKVTGEISTLPFAISQDWANQIDDSRFPDYFYVDYVRVYKKNELYIETP